MAARARTGGVVKTAAHKKGGGTDDDRRTTRPLPSTPSTAAPQVAGTDLPALRTRLCGARRRLVERLAEDYPPDRRFPDSGWSRLLADIQLVIAAVDAVAAEAGP